MADGTFDGSVRRIASAYVASWAAISVDAAAPSGHRFGECAEESIIPAALRRRLGVFGRMAVTCGLSVGAVETSNLVFCSRYGDVDLAYRLLSDLVSGNVISPAGFSLSVHNAVPGVMDLARKSRVGHTAVAAGSQSLSAGLTEAMSKLAENPHEKVSLVFAESPLPEVYAEKSESLDRGLALAFTLSASRPDRTLGVLTLDIADDSPSGIFDAPASETLAGFLVDALNAPEQSAVRWNSRGTRWTLQAEQAGINAKA
ncbi:MAG: beta-ketoacyl synthase chain length factor [Parvibaculum sp.]|jgi:hypothetical protein|uniref:beta-ketoacyl synthase chain length factor n=1 Tax=Parvibaculum sp. TaxID=2024848 RepID=UPI00283CE9DA|nr:beta-ketoacyl synthase chain length factor [Parvibaculum sp.]MDR3500938.1 beta-ketoacyl synthase chain length factor [Parvibaculum sp.]